MARGGLEISEIGRGDPPAGAGGVDPSSLPVNLGRFCFPRGGSGQFSLWFGGRRGGGKTDPIRSMEGTPFMWWPDA